MIRVGDTITFRGEWGTAEPTQAVVRSIHVTEYMRSTDTWRQVQGVSEELVKQDKVFFYFDDSWCHGFQVVLE